MRILVTGSDGFIARNLIVRLEELKRFEILLFSRRDDLEKLYQSIGRADAIVHLAGVNRPKKESDFFPGNVELTRQISDAAARANRDIPIIFASSIQAELESPYGKSKKEAEDVLIQSTRTSDSGVVIMRLPGVFGKWSQPNYNSVVSTFCHNIGNDLPIRIDDQSSKLRLVYVDDVVERIIGWLTSPSILGVHWAEVDPEYSTTVGELARQIEYFHTYRSELLIEKVGSGLLRALYATYMSYLPKENYKFEIETHKDARGSFVEVLKTKDSGQVSYFTANPGVTRGGHYHHTKTERFVVISGTARIRYRNLLTEEMYEVAVSGSKIEVVETIPGWAHDITNTGKDQLLVLLWANEVFDPRKPDTISKRL